MAAAAGGLRGLWGWYQARLVAQPVRTQVISSGVLWAVGDIAAQFVEAKIEKRPRILDSRTSSSSNSSQDSCKGDAVVSERAFSLDWGRVAKSSLFGLGFVGPVGHYWYEGLEHVVKTRMLFRPNSLRFVGTKVFVDSIIFGPIHLMAFFTYMGLASGKAWPQVKEDIKRDFPPTFMTEGSMWFVVQIANFRFVPVKHQLLFVNSFCVLDSAFLSWVKHQDDAPWKRYLTSLVTGKGVQKVD